MRRQEWECDYCGENYRTVSAALEVYYQKRDENPEHWNIGHEKCAKKFRKKIDEILGDVEVTPAE